MRKLSLMLFFVLVLCIGSVAFAQDAPFCGDLSADDCTLYTTATTTSPSSASFSANLDITVENAPDTTGPVTISLAVGGAYSGLDAAAMTGMSMDTTDPMAAITALPALLRSFDGELNLTLSVPAEVATGMPSEISLELSLVDGIGYINFDTLAPLLGSSAGGLTGWGGVDLAGAVEQLGPMLAGQLDPAALGATTGGLDPNLITNLLQAVNDNDYVTLSRIEDADGYAVFVSTVDFAALSADPAFMELITASMQSQGQQLTPEQMTQMQEMMPALLGGITFASSTVIDPATNTVVAGAFELTVNGETIDAVAAQAGEPTDSPTPNISVAGVIEYADINTATVVAPEGAQVVPLDQLMGLAMGAMSGQ